MSGPPFGRKIVCAVVDIPSPQSTNLYLEAKEWLSGLPTLSADAASRLLAPQDSSHTLPLQKIRIKKGATEPEMLTYHPQDPQNREY